MIHRLSRYALCGGLIATLGCQNPLGQTDRFSDRDTLETRLTIASDDPSGLESGRGHLPSLASEMADRRQEAKERKSSRNSGGTSAAVQRLLERGHEADAQGRVQEAKTSYEEVLSEQPHHPEAHHRLAILADRAGDYAVAETHYQQALRGKPQDADLLNDLGYSYFLQGRGVDSERTLTQAKQINPQHPHVQENLSLLYDLDKAEKVLLRVMGPRQAQATLAQLFQAHSQGLPRQTLAQMPQGGAALPNPPRNTLIEDAPADLESLQRRMEGATPPGIAEDQQQTPSTHQTAIPQQTAQRPPRIPPQHGFGSSTGEISEGWSNPPFQALDNGGQFPSHEAPRAGLLANQSSQVLIQPKPRSVSHAPDPPVSHPTTSTDPRAATPQWNTPPQIWPEFPRETPSSQTIEQTSYTQPAAVLPASNPARDPSPSAIQRAAEVGMAAGPGAIFPYFEDSPDSIPQDQFHPGTWEPASAPWTGQIQQQPETPPAPFRRQNPASMNVPSNGVPHDFTPALPNAPFHQDQKSLASQAGGMTMGHAGRETPSRPVESSPQPWPDYPRTPRDTRQNDAWQMDQPPAIPQPARMEAGHIGGQSIPQSQPIPQIHGRSW